MKDEIKTKDIPGYEGLYCFTPQGEVYSYRKGIPLKIRRSKNNCYYVEIFKDKIHSKLSMSKIVCLCYFGGIKHRFGHKNGDTFDFSYDNLIPKRIVPRISAKGKRKPIVRIKDGKITFYGSGKECAKDNYVPASAITNYCKGKRTPLDDVIFMYESDYYRKYGEEYDYHPTR